MTLQNIISQHLKQYALALVILLSALPAQAQEASLNGVVLTIPVVVVGTGFFSVELTIVPGSNPVEFDLTGAADISGVSAIGATTLSGTTLSIRSITVEGVSYWVDLVLISDNPVKLRLSNAGVVLSPEEQRQAAFSLFETAISQNIIQTRCIACHVEGGPARATELVYQRSATASLLNNFSVFESFVLTREDGVEYILSKASGLDHEGGAQLPSGGADYNNLQSFLSLLSGSNSTNQPSTTPDGFFSGVSLLSNTATLRRAAIMLAGRLPTSSEMEQVVSGDEQLLRTVLRNLMQGEGFHKFLVDGANDQLLVRGTFDAFLSGCNPCFPVYRNRVTELALSDLEQGFGSSFATTKLRHNTDLGLKESPLELIAYVAENDLPYSEILTADYMMLNPTANFAVEGTAVFDDPDSPLEFQPGRVTGYYVRTEETVIEQVPEVNSARIIDPGSGRMDIPHAGILSTQSFLFKYPTTATNRNRARARWTVRHFLGVDIERSAQRTTDPIALADTNNPTLFNQNCTVCHVLMDPVAGAFQNYSDEGFYRFNGLDSLDEFYKNPEDGSSPLYQHGDTWYRDMLTPGIFEATAPSQDNSLQWLAQQIVEEPSFATAAVKFWWPSIMGSEALRPPEVEEDSIYQSHLTAFDAQNLAIQELTNEFVQSGMNLKDLLVDMMMTPWFRASSIDESKVTDSLLQAHELANLGNEVLLTPERLQRKTAAITGFNWRSFLNQDSTRIETGFDATYGVYYGGINSLSVTKRSTEMTPLMSTVAMAHALESACPIVLREFILPDGSRKLFNSIDQFTTPLSDGAQEYNFPTAVDNPPAEQIWTVDLQAGEKNIVASTSNGFCDWDSDSQQCRTQTYLEVDRMEIIAPGSGARSELVVGENSCGATVGASGLSLFGPCRVSFPFTATTVGEYSVIMTFAAQRTGAAHVDAEQINASLAVESAVDPLQSQTIGAIAIKDKLVDLHEKMLGKQYAIDSPEIELSYELFVSAWQDRVNSGEQGSLFGGESSTCTWTYDYNFMDGLGFDGEVYTTTIENDGHSTEEFNWESVGLFLNPLASDTAHAKRAWVTVISYLMTHYYYLYE
jgi:hypothetical protein